MKIGVNRLVDREDGTNHEVATYQTTIEKICISQDNIEHITPRAEPPRRKEIQKIHFSRASPALRATQVCVFA